MTLAYSASDCWIFQTAKRSYLLPSGHTLYCCLESHQEGHHLHDTDNGYWPDGDIICVCGACVPDSRGPFRVYSLDQLRPLVLITRKWMLKKLKLFRPEGSCGRDVLLRRFKSHVRSFNDLKMRRSTILSRGKILRCHSSLISLGADLGEDVSTFTIPAKFTSRPARTKLAAKGGAKISCSCGGACKSCSCAKANRNCSQLCHKRHGHDNCQRMP